MGCPALMRRARQAMELIDEERPEGPRSNFMVGQEPKVAVSKPILALPTGVPVLPGGKAPSTLSAPVGVSPQQAEILSEELKKEGNQLYNDGQLEAAEMARAPVQLPGAAPPPRAQVAALCSVLFRPPCSPMRLRPAPVGAGLLRGYQVRAQEPRPVQQPVDVLRQARPLRRRAHGRKDGGGHDADVGQGFCSPCCRRVAHPCLPSCACAFSEACPIFATLGEQLWRHWARTRKRCKRTRRLVGWRRRTTTTRRGSKCAPRCATSPRPQEPRPKLG